LFSATPRKTAFFARVEQALVISPGSRGTGGGRRASADGDGDVDAAAGGEAEAGGGGDCAAAGAGGDALGCGDDVEGACAKPAELTIHAAVMAAAVGMQR